MRLLTGVRPTGDLHIGNYFGAIHPLLNLGEESNELFLFVADLHALTSSHDYDSIRSNTLKLTAALISLGFDTEKNTLWIQSNVPVVCEFMYLLSTLTGFQYLRKGHAFKAALQEVSNPSVALFLYPVLMAADILCFQADAVPVGQDQKQHLEICRDLAERLNLVCPQAVKVPEAIILEEVALIPGIDGRKMSKSYGNTIPIFEDDKVCLRGSRK
ncbi:MAG: tryptophan--tRNA ligase [Deltaproteobacteria bacterium]|nr:tryptophan--tRNA ligase [Deltaproteobacteria bacterium]